MSSRDLVIAIDGPAASGKSTLARGVADHFKLPFLDTGLIYRAVARRMIDNDVDPDDAEGGLQEARALQHDDIDETKLRGEAIGQWASAIAVNPDIRATLLPFQQLFAQQPGGAVLVGRDTGTVVCPEALIKLFITASVEARADRRFNELQSRGDAVIHAQVLAEMKQRDGRDKDRDIAPLRAADDAVLFDTSNFDLDSAQRAVIELIENRVRQIVSR